MDFLSLIMTIRIDKNSQESILQKTLSNPHCRLPNILNLKLFSQQVKKREKFEKMIKKFITYHLNPKKIQCMIICKINFAIINRSAWNRYKP